MTQRPYKRSIKNYLIDSRYQLKFTLFMVVLSAVLMAGLGWLVMDGTHTATKLSVQKLQSDGIYIEALGGDPEAEIARTRANETRILYILIGSGFVLCIGLFFYGVKTTHKIAGPMHKISLYLDKVAENKYDPVYPLRKGDQLVEFFAHFKEAHEVLKEQQEQDARTLRGFLAAVDEANVSDGPATDAINRVREVLKAKEASLG